MDKREPSVLPEQEEEITVFSIKNLVSRLFCIIALSFAVKYLVGKGQLLFAAVIGVCVAGFAFSLVMYLMKVFQSRKKK